MVTVAGLESGIYNYHGFAPNSGHLVFCVLSSCETGLLLAVKLGRNVVMMRAGVKIMHHYYRVKKIDTKLKKKKCMNL